MQAPTPQTRARNLRRRPILGSRWNAPSNLTGRCGTNSTNGKRTSWFPDLFLPIADKMERDWQISSEEWNPSRTRKSQKQESPLSLRKHHDTTRTELAKFGKDSIGKAEREFQGGFIPSLLASIEKEGRLPDDTPSTLYKSLRNQGLSFETETPQLGDLVFFHNTFDANKDGRNNDWYSTCGVVTGVSGDGVVEFVATVNGKVDAFSLNVQRPEVREMSPLDKP